MYNYNSSQTTSLSDGDLVKVNAGHANGGAEKSIYRYTGSGATNVNLNGEDYTVGDWEYVGSSQLSMQDYGNTDLWKQVNLVEAPVKVESYILNSDVDAKGELILSAISDQSIDALVVAGSAGIAVGGVGVAVSGAGTVAINTITVDVRSYIGYDIAYGDRLTDIETGSVIIRAEDISRISAVTGAASLSAGLGGVGVAVSIGVAGAYNEISNEVSAFIADAEVTTTDTSGAIKIEAVEAATINSLTAAASVAVAIGGVGVSVSGAGAAAINIILTTTEAYVTSSTLISAGDVVIKASDSSTINAIILASTASIAGGGVGVGVSIGASFAGNFIGYYLNGQEQAAGVMAYVRDSSINASGDLVLTALANEKIYAVVLAGSAAIAGGGVGVAGSGAGVSAINRIANHVAVFIDGDGTGGINADSVTLSAHDTSAIDALGGAASLAFSFAGTAAASLSVGVALAENSINNLVQASISNADVLEATFGDVTLSAIEENSISAETAAASAAAAIAPASIAISGGAASALNTITSTTTAFIDHSADVQAAGAVTIDASDTATIDAEIDAISAAGGFISVAVGLGLTTNKAKNTVRAYVRDSSVTANGAVTVGGRDIGIRVTASSNPAILTQTEATALSVGFGVGVAGAESQTIIEVITEAFIQSATLSAPAGDVIVHATSTSLAEPVTKGNSGGAIAVSLLNAEATIGGATRAYVGGTGSVTANKLDVQAFDTNTAKPKTKVEAAGAITINKATSDITLTRTTEAQIKSGTDLTMTSGNLVVRAESNSQSDGAMDSTGVGAITLDFLEVTSSIDSTTRAEIASGARVSVPGGNVDVEAVTTNRANARTSSFSIGAVTFGKSDPTAKITATTEALALGDITGPDGRPGAINVRVTADGNDATRAGAESFAAGLVSIGSSTVVAETSPTVTAKGGGTIRASSDVVIDSTSVGDADAASKTTSGGAVAVTNLDASAKAVTNVKTEILPNTIIVAGGDITISASHGELPAPTADGTFNAATDVTLSTNTIDLGLKHGLLTGDTVTYDSKEGTVIGGLGNDRTYGVINTSDSELQLGTTFQTAGVDTATDVLTFTAPHNLQNDDRVIYQSDGGAGVGGLNSGKTYQVVVIDRSTIKLIDPENTPAPVKDFSGTDIAGDTITLAGHGFSDGQAVTYRAPGAAEFGLLSVDVVGGSYNADDPAVNTDPADNNNIYLGQNHGLTAGDEVIYTAASGTPIPELTSGDRYFVIFDSAKPDEIQLALRFEDAIGDPGDPDATPDPIPPTPPNPIALSRSTDPADEDTPLSLRKVTDLPIPGLNDGVTYYVTQVFGDNFKLATDAAGTNIVTPGAVDPVSGTVVLTGTSTLGTEGVDLTNTGSGAHRLVLDLTSAGSGTQVLDGVGGARALAGAPSGDGVVTASASGSGGGIVRSSDAKTSAANKPTVTTIIGNGASLGGNDISVDALSIGNASASSANSGGGLVSIGDAESHLTVASSGRVDIGAATLTADHNITVVSNTTVNGSVLASSNGGGLVDFADADVTADITYASTVDIGADADLRAKNLVTVDSVSATNVSVRAIGDSAGLGSSADTTAFLTIGDNAAQRAVTKTVLGERTRLQGGNEVIVSSRVTGLVAGATAEAESGGAVADADATARIDIYDAVKVDLAADVAITAETVTISATHSGINLSSRSDADTDGFYANADSEARVHYNSLNDVVTASGVTVAAGQLGVTSSQRVSRFSRRATADVDIFGDETRSTLGDFLPGRSIDWNGDVTFLADPTPELEIAANGDIVVAEGVTVNGKSTGNVSGVLNLSPIVNNDGGSVTFTVNDNVITGLAIPDGEINGSGGTIGSGSTFPRVEITNRSNDDLVIHDINLANGTVVPYVTLTAKSVTLEFEVGNLAPGGDLDVLILNEGTGDVRIDGLVENPLGLIRIENQGGAIVSNDGTDDIIRGQKIELFSATGIGTNTLWLNADLVTSERRTTDFDAQATEDIWLNLTGRVRDTDSGNSHFNAGRVETSAGDVNILFQSSLQEFESNGLAAGVSVEVLAASNSIDLAQTFLEHFRPDTATGPAPLDFRLFADTAKAVMVDGSYSFEQITGTNINLNAANSAAGDPRVDVTANTNHGDTGQIDALFNGSIILTETAGDFLLRSIHSTAGNIDLTVVTGGAQAVFIQANAGNIDLFAGDGDIEVILVRALAGDVSLTALGTVSAIFETGVGDDGETPFVTGNSISLHSTAGIGSVTDFFEINSSNQATGTVFALANDSVFLTETSGDLNLDGVASAHEDVSLLVLSGSILDGIEEVEDLADIQGRDIDLIVNGGGIGASDNDVEINGAGSNKQNNSLQISTGQPEDGRLYAIADQSIYLKEVNASLDVMKVESINGDISLKVHDTTDTIAGTTDPLPEDLNLLAGNGQTLTGDAVVGGTITALNGSVLIDAGDDVNIPLSTLIQAKTAVTVKGDFGGMLGDERDVNIGTTITIEGDLQALTVDIMGGADLDFIQLIGTDGINAGGTTRMQGNDADDRLFVQGTQNALTLQGGVGADRYYLSSNAAKSLFMGGGYFDDINVDPFDLLTGTLDTMTATVSVETGEGGNGGTRDVVFASSAGSITPLNSTITYDAVSDINTLTSLGMTGRIDISIPDFETGFLMVGLGSEADTSRVKSLGNKLVVEIYARGGDDILNVHNDADSLADISGIVAFHGGAGSGDTLNVYGNATAAPDTVTGVDPDQLTAIGITGLEMGNNALFSTHERFGAGYDSTLGNAYPGAIYYATRSITNGIDSFESDVETVNVQLGSGDDSFQVDSVYDYGLTKILGGDGADTLIAGSTGTGLQPNFTGRVNFIHGNLQLDGEGGSNSIVVDDSGDHNANTGTYEGTTVRGLDIAGSISFANAASIEIRLGAQADKFYVPATSASLVVTLKTGGGKDSVYVGTTAGNESSGNLDAIAGQLIIEGEGPEADDFLYLNDQDSMIAQHYTINNEITGTKELVGGALWPIDTTTFSRSGSADILYRTMETVVLNGGSGNDVIDLESTHREQDVLGGKASVFVVNGGEGADIINIGEPVISGGHTLDSFAIDITTPEFDSVKGIPVMINGQGGTDRVHFFDDATTLTTNLVFAQRSFAELFPSSDSNDPDGADDEYIAYYENIFGEDPLGDYASVVISHTDPSTDEETETPININSRTMEEISVTLGSGDDVIQLVSGEYITDITVYAGAGEDTFNVESGVDLQGHSAVLNGEADDDILFADFETGVPSGTITDLTFNGGTNGGVGDEFRIAGDGETTGGTYTPSSTISRAGTLELSGNHFYFTGIEPVVIHGLPEFQVIASDKAADLTVDSINIEDLNLSTLSLQLVTIDGVISWTQESKLVVTDALEPEFLGSGVSFNDLGNPVVESNAMAMDGDTLVVGAQLDGADYGVIYVYQWTGSAWQEKTKLYPDDRGIAGEGFGYAVAIDGDRLVVGAPQDSGFATETGAVYVFERSNGNWSQASKFYASDYAAADAFGASVSVDGNVIVVGAPGINDTNNDSAYIFEGSGANWNEVRRLTWAGTDFGRAVAVANGHVAIGIPKMNRVYVYQDSASGWVYRTYLTASEQDPGEAFGSSLAMDTGRIVVGAPLWDGLDTNKDGSGDRPKQGRVFVFDGSGKEWVREARLTADGGLPAADSANEGRAGDFFGLSVATGNGYVIVGAPGYDSDALDAGAAYVFHEFNDPALANGTTWVRSSGSTGSGRLMADSPAGSDPDAPLADHFGGGVAISGSRIAVGMPGFNDTDDSSGTVQIIRADVGAFSTFITNGVSPTPSNANMRAEVLVNSTPGFAEFTHYDPTTRTLFVAADDSNTVFSYVNEGLYWRPSTTFTGGSGFGADIDSDGTWLVIGSPGENKAYVYGRSGDGWSTSRKTINGATYGNGGFGSAVAVDNNVLAIGAPQASLTYYSTNRGAIKSNGYHWDHVINLGNSGVVHVFKYNGSSWAGHKTLMPDDDSLPGVDRQEN